MKIVSSSVNQVSQRGTSHATCSLQHSLRSAARVVKGKAQNTNGSAAAQLPPEVAQMFKDTQRNLLDLNRSRLQALEELNLAHDRIAQLEDELETAQATPTSVNFAPPAEPAAIPEATPSSSGRSTAQTATDAATRVASGNGTQPAQAIGQHPSGQYYQQPSPPQSQPALNTITVAYETGWSNAWLHFCTDKQGWTQAPGVRMQDGQGALAGKKVLSLDGNRIEFVVNNGSGDWDTPNPYGSSTIKNYVIDSPGVYVLKAGQLRKL
jgi:negative regulator of replication initiation